MIREVRACPQASNGAFREGRRLRCALPAPHAAEVRYAFYALPLSEQNRPLVQVELHPGQHRFGGVWAWEAEIAEEVEIAYAIWIRNSDGTSGWIIDPYARASLGGERWGVACGFRINAQGTLFLEPRPAEMGAAGLRRIGVLEPATKPSARPARPGLKLEEVILYECHVRGMTQHPSSPAPPEHRGTFRGLADCIPHLKQLGVNVIELLPVFDFDERENPHTHPDSGEPLFNYWGYSPLLYFAPKASYAADPARASAEFREMVDAFHEAGIEVWLDVVFNHTGEMGADGPTEHFRLLGASDWYLVDSQEQWMNFSGCGNTLHCAHPVVRALIRDSLKYWSQEMGVDGFRFDLATILNRDSEGELRGFPRLMWELRHEPMLRDVKLISEPWDAGGGYQLGHGSWHADWPEWNDRFRDTLRRTVRGDEGMMQPVQQALLGHPEVFQGRERGRRFSVNFVTSHDGMTLADLTTYAQKHNHANGEENRDGHSTPHSDHCGVEGPTDDPEVCSLRLRRQRLFHLLLQSAHGLPMFPGGDEFGRTQQGNNNAYCHDSELTWLDWEQATRNQALLGFVRQSITFRKEHFERLFSDRSVWTWWTAGNAPADFAPHETTLAAEVTHPEHPALRLLLNVYHAPVEFFLPPETRWDLKLASSPEQQRPTVGTDAASTIWVDASAAVWLEQRLP